MGTADSVINKKYGLSSFLNIFMHNFWVMIVNYIGFIVSPVLIVVNWFTQMINTAMSIKVIGLKQTLLTILPYGLIEIMIITLYQFLSLNMLYVLYKTKKLMKVMIFIKHNYQLYLISFIGTLIAAVLEGVVKF